MLYLVGIGLSDSDVPVGALEACKRGALYVDTYTSIIDRTRLDHLASVIGKTPEKLRRSDLEENADKLIKRAVNGDIVLLVGGDPLIATTHKTLFIEAKKQGVGVRVIHAASVLSAAMGESGLDFYRFGAICTVPRWSAHYKPVSFYETIAKNLEHNLHSIVLLDYIAENDSSMPISDALDVLDAAEKRYGKGVFAGSARIIVMHNLGMEGQHVALLSLDKARKLGFNKGVTSIIVPAKLTDVERETIAGMYGGVE